MTPINLSGPDITQAEIDAVVAVLHTRHLSLGPKLGQFEQAFADRIGREHAIAVSSGTAGLHLALLAGGIGPGDEVITTPFSFIASTNVILMVGATPVFVDINPETLNLEAEAVAGAITPKTRAILPVAVFGHPGGLQAISELARERGLLCVEDSCEGLGSSVDGRAVGSFGDASVFAFYPNKQMTTGEGGMILTDDAELAGLCRSLRNQGRDDGAGWLQHTRLGYNYRLSEINCALGLAQLGRLEEILAKRSAVAGWYQEFLSDEPCAVLPQEPEDGVRGWFVYVVQLRRPYTQSHRDAVLQWLRDHQIGCSNYFTPIHLQPYIRERLGTGPGDFPVTEHVAQRTVALPFHGNLTREEVETASAGLRMALNRI